MVGVGVNGSGGDLDVAAWTSPDGTTWTRVTDNETVFGEKSEQRMRSVTAGGPGLVGVGHDGWGRNAAVWTSPDGITWTRVPHDEEVFGGEDDQMMQSATTGGPGLVAVGIDGPDEDRHAVVWISPDGITWTRVSHDEEVFGGEAELVMASVTAGGPGLVAVGVGGPAQDWDPVMWLATLEG